MNIYSSKGSICLNGPFNLTYRVCDIFYYLNSDDSFKYIFKPNYCVIELLDSKYFQGIPGLNLEFKKDEYIRDNRLPTFISERVPSKNRVDYFELLQEVNMECMDPIEYLIKTNKQYSGDKLFVLSYEDKKTIMLDEDISKTNTSLIKNILQNICLGNDIVINNQKIDDSNRKIFHDIFIDLYLRSYNFKKERQKEGILTAKATNRYKGRKPIAVDEVKFRDALLRVEKKEITSSNAARELGISIDKYYRFRKKLQN